MSYEPETARIVRKRRCHAIELPTAATAGIGSHRLLTRWSHVVGGPRPEGMHLWSRLEDECQRVDNHRRLCAQYVSVLVDERMA